MNTQQVLARGSRPLRLLAPSPELTLPQPTGRLPKKPAAVLFDIYGTLFISGSGDLASGREAGSAAETSVDKLCAAYSLPLSPEELGQLLREAVLASHRESREAGIAYPEVRIEVIWQRVLEKLEAPAGMEQAGSEFFKQFALDYELAVNPVWPMPGLIELLEELKTARLARGIVSNAQFFTPELFPAFTGKDLGDWGFDASFCHYSFQHGCAKPGKEIYEIAAQSLNKSGIDAKNCLFIGNDMLNDCYASSLAGFVPVLFAGDGRSLRTRQGDPRIAGFSPAAIVHSLAEIPELLRR